MILGAMFFALLSISTRRFILMTLVASTLFILGFVALQSRSAVIALMAGLIVYYTGRKYIFPAFIFIDRCIFFSNNRFT